MSNESKNKFYYKCSTVYYDLPVSALDIIKKNVTNNNKLQNANLQGISDDRIRDEMLILIIILL